MNRRWSLLLATAISILFLLGWWQACASLSLVSAHGTHESLHYHEVDKMGMLSNGAADLQQASSPRAAVVITFGDGHSHMACVDLGSDGQASGEEVLQQAGLPIIAAQSPGAGASVCKIEHEGCDYPTESCFCQCGAGKPCGFWSYFHQVNGQWESSAVGASQHTVNAGDVEGWLWNVEGSGLTLPKQSFDTICTTQQQHDTQSALSKALGYLKTQQNPDGGIQGYTASDPGITTRVVVALAATGFPIDSFTSTNGKTMIDYLKTRAITYTHGNNGTTANELLPAEAGRLLMALAAAHDNVTNVGGMNLREELRSAYKASSGAYSTNGVGAFNDGKPNELNQSWAILGLASAGDAIPTKATDFLLSLQAADGSWGNGDLDRTAPAVLALLSSGNIGPEHQAIQNAMQFFYRNQLPSGGWRPEWDSDPLNADTTGWVVQALMAAGYVPATESWAYGPANPQHALLSLQQANGSIGGTWTNALSTADALFGLVNQSIAFLGHHVRVQRALTWLGELQNSEGAWNGFGGTSDTGLTIDSVLAFAAAGYKPSKSDEVAAYLAKSVAPYASKDAASAGKLTLAIVALGENPRTFGGVNIVEKLTNAPFYHSGAFSDTTNTYNQAYGLLGLAAAQEPIATSMITHLITLQQSDGGWKYNLANDSWNTTGVDHTALALQALVAAKKTITATNILQQINTSIAKGVAFIQAQQDSNGHWGSFGTPNGDTTAYAIQALIAAGQQLTNSAWLKHGHSPLEVLATYQKSNGPFVYTWSGDYGAGENNVWTTSKAIPALLGVTLPISQPLKDFSPIARGANPDRMVAAMPYGTWNNGIDVVIPFGSDLNSNGKVTLDWRVAGAPSWTEVVTLTRQLGYSTAKINAPEKSKQYELRATFTDPDSVQSGTEVSTTLSLLGYVRDKEVRFIPSETQVQTITFAITGEKRLDVLFPPNATTEAASLLLTMLETTPMTHTGYRFAGWAFDLDATRDGKQLSDFRFAKPVTMTIHYSDADVNSADETKLQLFYLDGHIWQDAATTCTPTSQYVRDVAQNRLSVAVCHLSRYGLFSAEETMSPGIPIVYLPLIQR